MRQLWRMAAGRRRDEWSRFGQLLSLVHNRTLGEGEKATQPVDYWPDVLVTDEGREGLRKLEPAVIQITGKDLQRMHGVAK